MLNGSSSSSACAFGKSSLERSWSYYFELDMVQSLASLIITFAEGEECVVGCESLSAFILQYKIRIFFHLFLFLV